MEGCYPGKLRVWEGGRSLARDVPAPESVRGLTGPHQPGEFAHRWFVAEALNSLARCSGDAVEPYSLQWYLDIERCRHGRSGRWIPRLLEFSKHPGETLVGLGDGLGTDLLQYARHGTSVIVCSPSAQQLSLVRRNFELRGLAARFLHATPTCLPLESASIDVACVSSLQPDGVNLPVQAAEIYRILKPGGKILALTAARYDIDWWASRCLPWRLWSRTAPLHLSATTRFSARGLKRLFERFVEVRLHKRQLRRREVPPLWRWVPLPLLERLMGRVLIVKGFKPLSAAIALQAAA